MTLEELKTQASTLSPDDRLALAQHLFISAGREHPLFASPEIERACIDEAKRRDAEFDQGIAEAEEAFEVLHRLRARLTA